MKQFCLCELFGDSLGIQRSDLILKRYEFCEVVIKRGNLCWRYAWAFRLILKIKGAKIHSFSLKFRKNCENLFENYFCGFSNEIFWNFNEILRKMNEFLLFLTRILSAFILSFYFLLLFLSVQNQFESSSIEPTTFSLSL